MAIDVLRKQSKILRAATAVWLLCFVPAFLLFGCGENDGSPSLPKTVETFPVRAADASGTSWLVSLAHKDQVEYVRIEKVEEGKRREISLLRPDRTTGLAFPAIAPFSTGCIVAFAVEIDAVWRIAYVLIEGSQKNPLVIKYLPHSGSVNVAPAVAVVNGTAAIAWESNAGETRGIYACFVTAQGAGPVSRLSSATGNGYNPTVAALSNGDYFVAWDAYEAREADIYGAWCRNGVWQAAQRLTSDPRIERYPALAVWNDEVWICWQAQSYGGGGVAYLSEQRIVVARWTGTRLEAPLRLFEAVSTPGRLLMHPQLAFDREGVLWLTARLGMENIHAGWQPVLWSYSGDSWSDMTVLSPEQGRWHPVPLVFTDKNEIFAVVQSDDLPHGWDSRVSISNLQSSLALVAVARPSGVAPMQTRVLTMPATTFSLSAKMELCNADLPRQNWSHGGKILSLYWGDLHEHTDISVCIRRYNPPGKDLLANLRDIERLDFAALTDHDFDFDHTQWSFYGEQIRYSHDPGRFVTFLGQEWTSSKDVLSTGYGHRNLLFLDPFHQAFYASRNGNMSPRDLWDRLQGVESITIPHQLADWQFQGNGNPPTDWNFTDERLQPVAEIFQSRGSYEYFGAPRQAPYGMPMPGNYLQDAWDKGIVTGVIASPDHGGGTGKAGVWAESLDRSAIFAAIRARHTFGTTGSKIALKFSSGEAMMGDRVRLSAGPLTFSGAVVAGNMIDEVVIFRNNQLVSTVNPMLTDYEFIWTDAVPAKTESGLLWYYMRVKTSNNELAWSSPIWFY